MDNKKLKNKIIELREKGKTYREICLILGVKIPKSTLSYRCKHAKLSNNYSDRIKFIRNINLKKARERAIECLRIKQRNELEKIRKESQPLISLISDPAVAKLVMIMLYWGEGTKSRKRAQVTFGNSDPKIIDLFLQLFRKTYEIKESKFRCTVLCRADQDIEKLEKFWQKITKIPFTQFYKTRIDKRTIGKQTTKKDYRGVCRIDYFSAKILEELLEIPKLIKTGL